MEDLSANEIETKKIEVEHYIHLVFIYLICQNIDLGPPLPLHISTCHLLPLKLFGVCINYLLRA